MEETLFLFKLSALLQKCHVGNIDCIVIFVSFCFVIFTTSYILLYLFAYFVDYFSHIFYI